MVRWRKWISAMLVAVSLTAVPAGALAATALQKVLYGAAAMVLMKQTLATMDGRQSQMLAATQGKTGVLRDEEYSQRLNGIRDTLEKTGKIKRHYDVYVNPSSDMNAFETIGGVISFNRGLMDAMNDDELAFVMSHEITHGEKGHAVEGAMKSVAVSTAVDVALGGDSGILDVLAGTLAVNYIDNEVVTMDQEKEADAKGFDVFKLTPYNMGAAPSSMVLLYEECGDLYTEGWGRVISPNNHPQMTSRIQKLGDRMTAWAGNRVQVGGATVYVNALPVVTPVVSGTYSARRRAWLVAGNLARLCHDVYGEAENVAEPQIHKTKTEGSVKLLHAVRDGEAVGGTWSVSPSGNEIFVDGVRVMSCAEGDDSTQIAQKMSKALQAKAAMLPEAEITRQDQDWLKIHGYKEKIK